MPANGGKLHGHGYAVQFGWFIILLGNVWTVPGAIECDSSAARKEMNVLVAHPGTQYSYQLAAELQRRDVLAGFYTGVAVSPDGFLERFLRWMPPRLRRRLANRHVAGVPSSRLHCRPVSELVAMWRLQRGGDPQQVWHRRAERFQQCIPDAAIASSSAVIGFDTAAWVLAKRAASDGIPFVLDQSIGHPDAKTPAYGLIEQQYPGWHDGITPRRANVRAAEQVEHDLATRVAAASSFTKRTLIDHGVDAAKIRVNPYGVNCSRFSMKPDPKSRPLRFIFVGLVDARKGIPLLLDAWRSLGGMNAELWIVGSASKDVVALLPELPGLKYWGKVPHAEVALLMQQCDALVFPSYFEGFGLVLLEAMASGLPVITTTATAGPDIVTEGEDGWVIEPGDLPRLTEVMSFCLEKPAIVREMGRMARSTAERFTWTAYGDRWMQILTEILVSESREPSCGHSRSAAHEARCNPTTSAAE
jgi:glycosyltransferase involved in cell wall biosynthesis